jgi:hypothetical protein
MSDRMTLLPPPPGTCPACATVHEPYLPHNAQSMYYQYRFYGLRGRWPTWADAAAHCTDFIRSRWRDVMTKNGLPWTEPADGESPIADPPEETVSQSTEIEVEVLIVDGVSQ